MRGFTLMELVLVIAILGIIAGLGMGSYANFLRQGSLDSAANEIVATLRKAQTNSQASSEDYAWGVYFDTTNKDTVFLPSSVEINSAAFNSKIYTMFDRPTGKPKSSFDGNVVIQLKGGS